MANRSDSFSVSPAVRRVSNAFRIVGWISFWVQIVLAAISTVVLIFAAGSFGRSTPVPTTTVPGGPTVVPPASGVTPGAGIGLFLAVFGLLALFVGAFWAFQYTRLSKKLKLADTEARPKPSTAVQQLYFGLTINMAGMLLTLLGAQAIVGALVAKAFAQGFGFLSGNFQGFINALDLFLVQANTNTLMAHFVGVVATLFLLRTVNR